MRLLLGFTAYDRRVNAATMVSLASEIARRSDRHSFGLKVVEDCGYIDMARNIVVEECVAKEYDALIFIDHDVSWAPGAVVRLVESQLKVAAGVYPKRAPDRIVEFPVVPLERPKRLDSWMTMASVPMGFCLIHVSVLKSVMEYYKRKYVFHTVPDIAQGFGEDGLFCKEYRDMGGDIWVDTKMKINHHDGTHVHSGDLLTWLRERKVS